MTEAENEDIHSFIGGEHSTFIFIWTLSDCRCIQYLNIRQPLHNYIMQNCLSERAYIQSQMRALYFFSA